MHLLLAVDCRLQHVVLQNRDAASRALVADLRVTVADVTAAVVRLADAADWD